MALMHAGTPASVTESAFAAPGAIDSITVFEESGLPDPPGASYVMRLNVCEPGAASTIAVQVSSSSAAGTLQFGELGVRFTALGVAPSMAIVSDWVAGDTYVRVRAPVAARSRGTMIVICALAVEPPVLSEFGGAVAGVVAGCNIELPPEPAHPASDSRSVKRVAARKKAAPEKPSVTRVNQIV
jgi:hypothetical protein